MFRTTREENTRAQGWNTAYLKWFSQLVVYQEGSGRFAARAEDAHGKSDRCYMSPSILVYETKRAGPTEYPQTTIWRFTRLLEEKTARLGSDTPLSSLKSSELTTFGEKRGLNIVLCPSRHIVELVFDDLMLLNPKHIQTSKLNQSNRTVKIDVFYTNRPFQKNFWHKS